MAYAFIQVMNPSVTQGIKDALDAANISIPFPQRDVHLFKETA